MFAWVAAALGMSYGDLGPDLSIESNPINTPMPLILVDPIQNGPDLSREGMSASPDSGPFVLANPIPNLDGLDNSK